MTELFLIYFLLAVAFVLAPLMTNRFFLTDSRNYSFAHRVSLVILLLGAAAQLRPLTLIWPLFCAYGFFRYLMARQFQISVRNLAGAVPFIFSLISSLWFVAGVYDWGLLGYNPTWSFYAALHGAFLGWIFVGCLAYLSNRKESGGPYLGGTFLSLFFFLAVAFGINGIPYLKRVGVIGFFVLVPFLIGNYSVHLKSEDKHSRYLSRLSLVSVAVATGFALLNEFWPSLPRLALGIPLMIIAHGIVNATLVIPGFFLAIRLERTKHSPAS